MRTADEDSLIFAAAVPAQRRGADPTGNTTTDEVSTRQVKTEREYSTAAENR